ncbi:MAG: DNA polymerase III subunit delta [Raoultibacter sp.]|jgi:DNA polymerase-3 subunit delta
MTQSKQNEGLLPVYLALGEDELKKQAVLKRLKIRVEALGDLSFNYDVFSGEQASGSEIVSACNTLPFASEVRLVQVDRVEKLKKPDMEALVEYLTSPASTTVLALFSDSLAKNTRLYKAISKFDKKAIIDCSPLKRYDLVKMLRSLAEGYGIRITDSAAHALTDLVGENTVRLDNELRKIALAHRGNDAVSEHEVKSMVSRSNEAKPWEFVDALSARNIDKALLTLSRMPSSSPHALLAMCTTRIRELICAQSLAQRGNLHELAGVLKMPPWRVKNHKMWLQGFSPEELRVALISSRDAERKMKSGTNPDAVFLEWCLQLMRRA